MPEPKLHHYVPQFYLRRFVDASDYLWLWERDAGRIFKTKPTNVAAENYFYYLTELVKHGHDPLTMEKQFSYLEGEVAKITDQWLDWLRQAHPLDEIPVPEQNRDLVALYIALQYLRTAGHRDILAAFAENTWKREPTAEEKRLLHTDLLWDEPTFRALADRIKNTTWAFGRNSTSTLFITSDNPVAFRKGDNSQWWKLWLNESGAYIAFPLAPDLIMYCYPKNGRFEKLAKFDRCLSPVTFTDAVVQGENTGQVFLASRFVISSQNNFDAEKEFHRTIRYVR